MRRIRAHLRTDEARVHAAASAACASMRPLDAMRLDV
jgi:hypothetical protein